MKISDARAGDILRWREAEGRYLVFKTTKNPLRAHTVYLGKGYGRGRVYQLDSTDMVYMYSVQETIQLPAVLKLLKHMKCGVHPR